MKRVSGIELLQIIDNKEIKVGVDTNENKTYIQQDK